MSKGQRRLRRSEGCGACKDNKNAAPTCTKFAQHVAVGRAHACATFGAGELYCWGSNDLGQLGLGNADATNKPKRVGGDSNWSQIAAAGNQTCGIRGGALYCWGDNYSGQLGNGTGDDRMEPTRVGNDSDWSEVSVGDQHVCATRGGELYCWGDNSFGQLGDGSMDTTRWSPLAVKSDQHFDHVACGDGTTCAVGAGALYCFGDNSAGQLGTNAASDGFYNAGTRGYGQRLAAGIGRQSLGVRDSRGRAVLLGRQLRRHARQRLEREAEPGAAASRHGWRLEEYRDRRRRGLRHPNG